MSRFLWFSVYYVLTADTVSLLLIIASHCYTDPDVSVDVYKYTKWFSQIPSHRKCVMTFNCSTDVVLTR